jgi:hypothetical protein
MTLLHKDYLKQLKESLGYWATWFPSSTIRLGDVVCINRSTGELDRVGNVADYGIALGNVRSSNLGPLRYISSDVTVAVSDASVTAGSNRERALDWSLSFRSAGGVVFQCANCMLHALPDIARLGDKIIELDNSGAWAPGQLIVTEVVCTEQSLILISQSAGATATLQGKISSDEGANPRFRLDGASGVTMSQGLGFQLYTEDKTTPLFQAHYLKTRFLQPTRFTAFRLTARRAVSKILPTSYRIKENSEIQRFFIEADNEIVLGE